MNSLFITLWTVIAVINVISAIKEDQVQPGALAKFRYNGSTQKRRILRIAQSLNGQIVKIMANPRSSNGTRIAIQSLTNPTLTLGVKRYHLEAMEIIGLVNQPEFNGKTVVRTKDPIFIRECQGGAGTVEFRIPVQIREVSARGKLVGHSMNVKLQNLKYISNKVLDECCTAIARRVTSSVYAGNKHLHDVEVSHLLQILKDQDANAEVRLAKSFEKMKREVLVKFKRDMMATAFAQREGLHIDIGIDLL